MSSIPPIGPCSKASYISIAAVVPILPPKDYFQCSISELTTESWSAYTHFSSNSENSYSTLAFRST